MNPISTTSARQQRRMIAIAAVAVLAAAASIGAQAGECPVDKVVADGKGQPMSAEPAKGVTDVVVSPLGFVSDHIDGPWQLEIVEIERVEQEGQQELEVRVVVHAEHHAQPGLQPVEDLPPTYFCS